MEARWVFVFLGAMALLALAMPAARADAIDGNWCADDGRHMAIGGSGVVTPGGVAIDVAYDRHAMSYTVPGAESGGLHSALAAAGSVTEVWRSCELTS